MSDKVLLWQGSNAHYIAVKTGTFLSSCLLGHMWLLRVAITTVAFVDANGLISGAESGELLLECIRVPTIAPSQKAG